MSKDARLVDAMAVQNKTSLVEDKIRNINLDKKPENIENKNRSSLKQEMDAAVNVWKPFQKQINLAYVKSLKMWEIQSFLHLAVKFVAVLDAIHKIRKILAIEKVLKF